MGDKARSSFEIDQEIYSSAGMCFINREHSRSFSINIFRSNARELIEALRHVSDPEHGLRLMALSNREAGTQAHREVSRRIHNFVAAAKTLVDHTRVFMRYNYEKLPPWHAYNEEVRRRFQENEIAKFVHDLRNYMLHCGLPNSTMFIHYSQNPEKPNEAGQLTTGVQLGTRELMNWDGWTAPARAYLVSVGDEVPIESLVRTYVSQVEDFQGWISKLLFDFHAPDIAELEALRGEYELSKRKHESPLETREPEAIVAPYLENVTTNLFSIPPTAAVDIDRMGDELLTSIRELNFAPLEQEHFKSDRPIGATITADDLINQPVVWREDEDGNQILAFIMHDSAIYGLDSGSLQKFRLITDAVLNIPWATRSLSEKFIQDTIINWCRSAFGSVKTTKLTEAITHSSREEVKPAEVWAPIAHLEIESGFPFGPVNILPITAAMIDGMETVGLESAPGQETQIRGLFNKLRSTMQGYAAVVVGLEAVSEGARVEGLAIAREAVNLLRFFSPAASEASLLCPTSLLGSELVPKSHILVLGDGSFSYFEGIETHRVAFWRMSTTRISELRQVLDTAGALIRTENLDEFERSVRSGMILFGTAATFGEPIDRLIYTLSAMEGVLLKHELEAAAYSVEERMARLLASDDVTADEVAHSVRAIYRLRAGHGSLQWSDSDLEVLQTFVRYAQRVLLVALQNIAVFGTRAEFIEAIERMARA